MAEKRKTSNTSCKRKLESNKKVAANKEVAAIKKASDSKSENLRQIMTCFKHKKLAASKKSSRKYCKLGKVVANSNLLQAEIRLTAN